MSSRIEDYALIGDCETAALVSREGSIDWLCWPRFDSGACFASLIGRPENGFWRLAPIDPNARTSRRYRGNTLILETTFETDQGAVLVTDFMPVHDERSNLVRIVTGLRGTVAMKTEIVLRFDYGAIVPWVTRLDDGRISAIAGPDLIIIQSDVALEGVDLTTVGKFTVREGERVSFIATWGPSHLKAPDSIEPHDALEETERRWTEWAERLHLSGRMARRGASIAHHPQGAHLSTDGRYRRRADDVASRAGRRRSQLGLSILLAARCDTDAPRADERGILPRSGRVA